MTGSQFPCGYHIGVTIFQLWTTSVERGQECGYIEEVPFAVVVEIRGVIHGVERDEERGNIEEGKLAVGFREVCIVAWTSAGALGETEIIEEDRASWGCACAELTAEESEWEHRNACRLRWEVSHVEDHLISHGE